MLLATAVVKATNLKNETVTSLQTLSKETQASSLRFPNNYISSMNSVKMLYIIEHE
jgi:hypothetical protein